MLYAEKNIKIFGRKIMTTNKIVKKLKENNEDFEFYPTTDKIIKKLYKDITKNSCGDTYYKILDIGAGNGKVLNRLEELGKNKGVKEPNRKRTYFTKYAIEKSKILVNQMADSIFIIGSDFYEQTLIDKKVDIIFCNPPYSKFKEWSKKIILESNAKKLYLLIPERWKKDKELKEAIKKRNIDYKVVGNFSFLESEDRKARAKVNLIRFDYERYTKWGRTNGTDPFDIWFENTFKFQAEQESNSDYFQQEQKKEELKSLIKKENLAKELVKFYNQDLDKLVENYKKIEGLDFEIFKELKVDIASIKESLKIRIKGLKNIYWKELFDNMEQITDRLTEKSREKLLDKLLDHTSVDFSESNIYAIIIWVVKNANKYFDSQLLDFYLNMADRENIIKYKSNKRIIEDDWRYNKKDYTHYALDYRIITHCYNFLDFRFNSPEYITFKGKNFIKDIFTIAKNLNIEIRKFYPDCYNWKYRKKQIFYYKNSTKIFMELRAYKNDNVHIKFNQEFIKKLNIEAARLNGWIKSPKEAAKEFDVTIEEATKYFKQSFKLLPENNGIVKLIHNKKN